MKPYYDDGRGIMIYHGDCRDVLPMLERGSVDLVLTDPPFFMPAIHYQSRVRWARSWGDTSILASFWSVILDAAIPTLQATGHLITFCNGDSYPVFYPEMYRRFDTLVALIWDKGHVGLGRVWRHQHEMILAGRWETAQFYEDGSLRSDILKATATVSTKREHPVEKPTALLKELMMPTTQHGGIVADPFMGSGSTLLAAKELGRRAIGCDTEERYCEIAACRLSQGVLPMEVTP